MARLTRMEKFAEKREQLANDKEEKIASSDLSSYQDRLSNVEDTLSFTEVDIKEEDNKDINPDYVWKPFEDDSFSQTVEPIKAWEEPIKETHEEVKITEEVKPIEEAEPVEEIKPVETTPVFTEDKQEENSFFDQFVGQPENNNNVNDFKSYFETLNDDNSKGVFNDVSDDSGEIVSQKERDTYLNQTMSDVFSHNINNGQETIDTIVDSFVDEVRHGENKTEPIEDTESIEVIENVEPEKEEEKVDLIDNTYFESFEPSKELDADELVEEKVEVDDEEFSNTVSMEISKIMDEIAAAPAAPVVEETPVQEEVQETIQINEVVAEEKPEEVVEIKNISEVENEPVKDTMSSTIPFVVAAEDEDVDEDEDEEDGSNTVLNVILVVLIVVLVAVLGLIVFYILKTKGIF